MKRLLIMLVVIAGPVFAETPAQWAEWAQRVRGVDITPKISASGPLVFDSSAPLWISRWDAIAVGCPRPTAADVADLVDPATAQAWYVAWVDANTPPQEFRHGIISDKSIGAASPEYGVSLPAPDGSVWEAIATPDGSLTTIRVDDAPDVATRRARLIARRADLSGIITNLVSARDSLIAAGENFDAAQAAWVTAAGNVAALTPDAPTTLPQQLLYNAAVKSALIEIGLIIRDIGQTSKQTAAAAQSIGVAVRDLEKQTP